MAALEFLTLFLFFLPQISAKKCHELRCKTHDSPPVRFPFRLRDRQPPRCGYSSYFDLSCNQQKQTVLTLPSSSGDFTVESISYSDQSVWINDQNKCIPKRLLDNDFSLVGSPFQFEHGLKNYTFFNCSTEAPLDIHEPITCLSSDNYKVIALLTSSLSSLPPLCNIISTAMVPVVNYEWLDTDFGVRLTWGKPDCRSCELSGRVCGFRNASSLELDCSRQTYGFSGLSDATKFRLLTSVGVPGLVCITLIALYIFTLIRDRGRDRINEPLTELSSVSSTNIPENHVVITGLDDLTLESYPKIQLGEKWEIPDPDDSTCPICLCEYKPDEILRTIPECNHHFHAGCVDEWLRKNPTCPVCRKVPQEDNKIGLPSIETER